MTRVVSADATDELVELIEPPAVGVELPFESVDLPETVVQHPSPSDLAAAKTGITTVDSCVGGYGSVVINDRGNGAEPISLFAEKHVAVVAASDVVRSMNDALIDIGDRVRNGLSSSVIATGPSATADMGELVQGVHGPASVHVLLVTDR
nr:MULTISPECIES: LUD domain-containing protein [unclassified Haladaptatus]